MPCLPVRLVVLGSLCALSFGFFSDAWGYALTGRWSMTATDGALGGTGNAVRLTWSIVPDGTPMKDGSSSNLISRLDETFGSGPGGTDLQNRPWFPLIAQSFNRWSEVGGVTLTYEPNDDKAQWGQSPGKLGTRGDIRIGGHSIDGHLNVLGQSAFPSNGDMVIDTDDMKYFGNSSYNYSRFRNLVMHELGHGLGLGHIVSSEGVFLMEVSNNSSLSGPQFDDILGLHQLYGDRYEKSHNGAGNDTRQNATSLGTIVPGALTRVGADASSTSTVVTSGMSDFVSISNQYDSDFYSFRLSANAQTSIAVVPMGPTYDHARQGGVPSPWNTAAQSNLALALFDSSGNQLGFADNAPKGTLELLGNLPLLGGHDYTVRVTGDSHQAQLYTLYIATSRPDSAVTLFGGDFNGDMMVDAADYTVWRNSVGQTGNGLPADADGNGVVDGADYLVWKDHFGFRLPSPTTFLAGDYNRDGKVDAADYTVWRNALGQTGINLAADGNGDQKVDTLDYLFWKTNYQAAGSAAAVTFATSPVPAPASGVLAMLAGGVGAIVARHHARRRGIATCL